MAEQSFRYVGAASRFAFRDAYETDPSLNSRIIQRVDFSSNKFVSPIGYPKRGNVYTKAYTSGGTHQIIAGDILTGATSAFTCRVVSITLTSGSWASGDAAGVLSVVDKSGTFVAENLNYGGVDACTIAAGDLAAATLTAADTFDLTALPAELTQNLITVGDKSLLCVGVEQYTTAGTITISPILYDNVATPGIVGILTPRTFIQAYAFRRGASSGSYILPVQTWDIVGAYKIGVHMSAITGTSNYPYIYAWVI